MNNWKNWSMTLLLLLIALLSTEKFTGIVGPGTGDSGAALVIQSFEDRRSGVWVNFEARVVKLLRDDNDGSRHQRFIVRLENGHSLLVSHNIDLAARIPLRKLSDISIKGRYEWNPKGGVVHWTHHDPAGEIDGGWVYYKENKYD